jgi:rSAM/selenodomain-associated transferase 1
MIMHLPMTSSTAILLFIKAPVRGRVKTRLAAILGDDTTLELYRNFVLDILDTLDIVGHPCSICYSPPDAADAVAGWLGEHRDYMPQEGSDLGERMANAFQVMFSRGRSRVVLVGSDLPDLPPDIFEEALSALQTNDAVIGPALDGGYYLIGFRKETFLPEVFHGISWGTNTVQEQTIRIFLRAGCRVHSLPQWNDVDTADDLRSLAERNAGTAFAHSRTMKYIKDLNE